MRVDTLTFVTETLPGKLASALGGRGSEAEANRVLEELAAWVVDEEEAYRKKVADAVKKVAFVPCVDGERRPTKDLIDADLAVAKAFAADLQHALPEPCFFQAHRKMLKGLGMRSYLRPAELKLCADRLAASVEPPSEEITKQSFWLVEALASNLLFVFNKVDPAKRKPSSDVLAAAHGRVLLTTGPPTAEQLQDYVQRKASKQDAVAQPFALSTFAQTLVPACQGSAWSCLPASAHDDAARLFLRRSDDAGKVSVGPTKLSEVVEKHGSDLEKHLSFKTTVPLETMARHLANLTRAVCASPLDGMYREFSPLDKEIKCLLDRMDSAVRSPPRPAEGFPFLRAYSGVPCLPQHLNSNSAIASAASSDAPAYLLHVKLVAPSKVFWSLPTEETAPQEVLHKASYLLLTRREIAIAKELTPHSHLRVFKITRKPAKALHVLPPPNQPSTLATGSSAAASASSQAPEQPSGSDEFSQLVASLTEMRHLPTQECKLAARRLFRTWHPDRCRAPHAVRFFRIAYRFACLMEEGKRDEAEAFVASLLPDAEEPDRSQGYEEVSPHTWFAAFEEEERSRQQTAAADAAAAAAAAAAEGGGGGATPAGAAAQGRGAGGAGFHGGGRQGDAVSAGPPRFKCNALGDVEWQSAQQELHVARLLLEAQQWAASVFHAQQAVEHVIKAAMLRTCGVTGDEFRGGEGHSLTSLLQRTGLTSLVATEELQRLSTAYLATRYAPFPPPAAPSVPYAAYTSHDAEDGVAVASTMVEWGRNTEQVEPSLSQSQAGPQ